MVGDAELGAQLRHARIFRRDFTELLGRSLISQRRAFGDLDHRPVALAAQFGELGLQFLVELVRRVVAVERGRSVLGGRDIGEHFGRIGRVLGILDVGGDLRPVHPAALGLPRIVEHARGQFQFGFGELVRRSGSGKIRHRIVGRVEALGGGILQTGDNALAAIGQFAGLRPLRRIVARRVELLDGSALVLAVEIAQRFGADHVAQAVGDRLVGRSDSAHLHRLLGGFGGGRGGCRSRRRGGCGVVSRRCGDGLCRLGVGFGLGCLCGRVGLVRFRDRLCCVRHRGGGVHLEVADGGRRNVRRFGAGDCCVDRELGGAGARRGRLGRQCRGRGHREEGCRDGHQHAVKSCTIRRTVTHRHTPLGELPRHGTVVRYCSSRLAREAPARSVYQSYACTPRFKRRRYICPSHAASAMRDNSRQTDLKLPVCIRVAWFCHAPRLLSVTAKPRFKSFRTTDVVGLPRSLPCGRHNRPPRPLSPRPLRPDRWRQPRRACGRAWSGRS